MKLLNELINNKNDEVVDLSEGIRNASKAIGGWVSKNPVLAVGAAGAAMSAYSAYKKNKRYTTKLFAKTPDEKKLYKAIIADLMRTGNYKKIREKYVDGGILWELRRSGV